MMCKRPDGTSCIDDKWKNLIVILVGIWVWTSLYLVLWQSNKPKNTINGFARRIFHCHECYRAMEDSRYPNREAMMKVVLIILMCFMLTSCAGIRKFSIEMSEEDIKNAETSRIVAKNLLSTWPINSGFIRAALGPAGLSKLTCRCRIGHGRVR